MVYDLIIIGGGPAGVTAGIYSARKKINTLLITKGFGGQMTKKTVTVENYPGFEEVSGLDLIGRFEKQLRKQKIEILTEEVAKLEEANGNFLVWTKDNKKFGAKTVLITSGSEPKPLDVPGEKEFIGRGVSYCVNCDGPLFSGKTVAVVGGGNAGLEAALFLLNYARKIYILEYEEKLGADPTNQEKVKQNKKIEILTGITLKEIKGKKFVEQIFYQDKKNGREKILPVDGVFVEIGWRPATTFLKELVAFNEKKEIIIDLQTCQTKTPGVFAAGDVTAGKYKQIIIACGQGARAALAIYDYLEKK